MHSISILQIILRNLQIASRYVIPSACSLNFLCPIVSSFEWYISGFAVNGLSLVRMHMFTFIIDPFTENFCYVRVEYFGHIFFHRRLIRSGKIICP
jgi:hypothetical protein